MDTQDKYVPTPSSLSLTVRKEHRLMVIKRTGQAVIRFTWKTLLYALILTAANIII